MTLGHGIIRRVLHALSIKGNIPHFYHNSTRISQTLLQCPLAMLIYTNDRHIFACFRLPPTIHVHSWVNYERLLEEAVLYYRSGGATGGSRVPVGEAFMTTHSFADEVLDGEYKVRVREYKEGKESLLTTCRDTVRDERPSRVCISQRCTWL